MEKFLKRLEYGHQALVIINYIMVCVFTWIVFEVFTLPSSIALIMLPYILGYLEGSSKTLLQEWKKQHKNRKEKYEKYKNLTEDRS